MEQLSILKDKIEELREALNQAITDGLSSDEIYKRSIALDKLIEQYMDLA